MQVLLLGFWVAFQFVEGERETWLGYAFFVAASVLNLLIVSIFWSVSNEAFSRETAQRAFGPAAAGGSLGAIVGSAVVASLGGWAEANPDHVPLFLIASALVLEGAIHSSRRVLQHAPRPARDDGQLAERDPASLAAFEGSAWSGWRDLTREPFVLLILGYMLFHSFGGTWAYFLQGEIIAAAGGHVQKFAWMNLTTNSLTLVFQLLLVGRSVRGLGVGITLAVLPTITAVGFVYLAAAQSYGALMVFQTLRRSASYGFSKPTREMLFSIFTPEQKYKLKNLVDVAGYRTTDLLASTTRIGLQRWAISTGSFCLIAAQLCALWLIYNLNLGRVYRRRAARLDGSGGAEC